MRGRATYLRPKRRQIELHVHVLRLETQGEHVNNRHGAAMSKNLCKSTIQMPVGTPSISQRCLHKGSHVRAGRVPNLYNPRQGAFGALTSVRYSPTLKLKDVKVRGGSR